MTLGELIISGDSYIIIDGAARTDVTAVVLHVGATAIQANVRHGRYAAWWPRTVAQPPHGAAPGQGTLITADVSLADGRALRDLQLGLWIIHGRGPVTPTPTPST